MLALRRTAAAAAAVLLTAALAGCTGDGGDEEPQAEPATTPLSAYDPSPEAVARGAFCDLVDDDAVTELIGGEPERERSWGDGDELPFGGDVGQEWGCDVTGPDGDTLRAWVFAPPVAANRARTLAADLREGPCSPVADRPDFGTPGAAVSCRLDGGARLVRFAGLFEDAWLTCELHAPREVEATPDELVDRTGRWCVAVLEAASTTT